MQLQRLAALEINERRSFVGTHRPSALDLLVGERLGHIESERARGGDNFEHQFPHQLRPARVGQEDVGREAGQVDCGLRGERQGARGGREPFEGIEAGGARHSQSVEGDVPDQLLPMRSRKVVGDGARHTGAAEPSGEVMGARLGRTLKLAQDDLPIADVPDDPRRDAIQAYKAEPAHDLSRWEQARDLLLVAQAVLQGEHSRRWTNQRRQQFGELIVGGGFEPDEDKIGGADLLRVLGALRSDLKVAFGALDADALASDSVVVGPEQEMDLMPGARELGAVIASDRAAANDGDLHGLTKKAP